MSCEEESFARILKGTGNNISLQEGPFEESVFSKLPSEQWTLLVQEVDHWVEGVAEFRELFNFIPYWRMDDVAISFATNEGTVGAHFDLYDVFITQVEGERKWQIEESFRPPSQREDKDLEEHPDLKLLKNFKAHQEWVLKPGDILYLPPGWAHYGISLGESLSFSMGFRAPKTKDVLAAYFENILDSVSDDSLLVDPNRLASHEPALLNEMEKSGFPQWPSDLRFPEESIKEIIAKISTRPIRGFWVDENLPTLPENLEGVILSRAGGARLCYFREGEQIHFYANGESYILSKNFESDVSLLSKNLRIDFSQLKSTDQELRDFINFLLSRGVLILEEK